MKVYDMHDLTERWVEVEVLRIFAIDGRNYEIDLCREHDAALDAAPQPYVERARKIARSG